MASAFLYYVLAVLVIAVHTGPAFSMILEKLKLLQKSNIFQFSNHVSIFEVYRISIPGAQRRRNGEEIKWQFDFNCMEMELIFKPTAGHLANKYTPVWSAIGKEAYNGISYEPLPTAMSDIGEFKMYHDVNNEAAITVYTDPAEKFVIEGMIKLDLAIMSVSRSDIECFAETPIVMEASNISDAEEDTGYCIIFSLPPADRNVKRSILVDPGNLRREKRASGAGSRQNLPKAVYPEILIVFQHYTVRNKTTTDILRYILAFWNGVDLIYTTLDKPKVYPVIAGIIIGANTRGTPYFTNTRQNKVRISDTTLLNIGEHFYKEKVRFPMERFDIIMAMTARKICDTYDPYYCGYIGGQVVSIPADCSADSETSGMKSINNTAIVHYNWKFGGVDFAAHEIGHLLGVKHDMDDKPTDECYVQKGYVMRPNSNFDKDNFKWSNCSLRQFSQYFSSKESECLDNEPLWTKPVGEVLPGRWLTTDGQCRNDNYEKACQLNGTSICMAKGCQKEGSDACVPTGGVFLPGTKCGNNKYCNRKNECVDEL